MCCLVETNSGRPAYDGGAYENAKWPTNSPLPRLVSLDLVRGYTFCVRLGKHEEYLLGQTDHPWRNQCEAS